MANAQGALEYLLLIGGAVVVAIIVITLMIGLGGQGQEAVTYRAIDAFCAQTLPADCGSQTKTIGAITCSCTYVTGSGCRIDMGSCTGGTTPANNPPNAEIDTPTADTTINEGESINFTGTVTDDGSINEYQWDFGGGAANSNVEDPGSIQFNTPGTYTVTFNAQDDALEWDPTPDSVTITVNATPCTDDPGCSAPGTTCVDTDTYQTCADTDSDGCLEKQETDCMAGETCDAGVCSAPPAPTELLSEGFDGGLSGWPEEKFDATSCNWSIVTYSGSTRLRERSNECNAARVSADLGASTHYEISFDVASEQHQINGYGFVFSFNNTSDFYLFRFDDPLNEYPEQDHSVDLETRYSIYRNVLNINSPVKTNVTTDYPTAGVFETYRIVVDGANVKVYRGADEVLNYDAGSAIPLGRVGPYSWDNDDGVYFDNIIVTDLG
ncbi:MAG: PKD domain-containing protein [Candidatus Diapherotrites archaeon]